MKGGKEKEERSTDLRISEWIEGRGGDTANKVKIDIHVEFTNLSAHFHKTQHFCSRTLSCSVIKVALSPLHVVKSQSSWRELLRPSASLGTPWHTRQTNITSSEAGDLDDILQYLWHEHLKKTSNSKFSDLRILIKNLTRKFQKHTGISDKNENSFGDY